MTWGFIDGRVYVPERKSDIPYGWDWLINALEAGGELYYKGKILYKKENTMKIEVGKFYRTRGGEKVRIYATDGGTYPIHGAIYQKGMGWVVTEWSKEGYIFKFEGLDDFDIVGEWKDEIVFDWSCLPAWADQFIAMDQDGRWFSYPDSPTFNKNREVWGRGNHTTIPLGYFPKGFTGDWTESLMKNPKYK